MRIVSLLPSATEFLCLLGLEEQLVGVTHECDFPPGVRGLPKVTRTLIPTDVSSRQIDQLVRDRLETQAALYSLDLPVLESLQPDLIVTQALCDVCAVAEDEVQSAACALPGSPRVINLEPMSLDEVLACLVTLGEATGTTAAAEKQISRLRERITAVEARSRVISEPPRVMLLEWIDPPFSAGHWNPELVRLAGGIEVIGREGAPSRAVAWEEIVAADPQVMVISCCGFDVERTLQDVPFLRGYPGWSELSCVQNNRMYVVNGSDYFSRPGPRLVDSLEILAHTIHPNVHPLAEERRPQRAAVCDPEHATFSAS